MTVMFGLPQRLASTRLMAIVEIGTPRGWQDIVRALPQQCGALVIASARGAWRQSVSQQIVEDWPQDIGRRLLGVDVSADAHDPGAPGRRLAEALQPDLVVESAPTLGWPHKWALHGAHCPADGFDFCLVDQGDPGLPGKPAFVVVNDVNAAGRAIAAGATRLAWRIAPLSWWSRSSAIRRNSADMSKAAGMLQAAWRRVNPEAAAQADKGWRRQG